MCDLKRRLCAGRQAVSLAPVTPPSKPVQQDLRVGLVYDPCMQDHIGPPSAMRVVGGTLQC